MGLDEIYTQFPPAFPLEAQDRARALELEIEQRLVMVRPPMVAALNYAKARDIAIDDIPVIDVGPLASGGRMMVEPLPSCRSVVPLVSQLAPDAQTVAAGAPIDLDLAAGEVLCILGESGSGKSVTLRALMKLLPKFAQITGGIEVGGRGGGEGRLASHALGLAVEVGGLLRQGKRLSDACPWVRTCAQHATRELEKCVMFGRTWRLRENRPDTVKTQDVQKLRLSLTVKTKE